MKTRTYEEMKNYIEKNCIEQDMLHCIIFSSLNDLEVELVVSSLLLREFRYSAQMLWDQCCYDKNRVLNTRRELLGEETEKLVKTKVNFPYKVLVDELPLFSDVDLTKEFINLKDTDVDLRSLWGMTLESTRGDEGKDQFEYKLVVVFLLINRIFKEAYPQYGLANKKREEFLKGFFRNNPSIVDLINFDDLNFISDFDKLIKNKINRLSPIVKANYIITPYLSEVLSPDL
jgi:hypothetical protein